jgi:Icc-related predicted phosphoesterase
VHGEVVEVEGLRLGLVGGGIATPVGAEGEVSDEEMVEMLDGLGGVDILCTHVPPALPPLRRDVITGREERGSVPIRDYLLSHQPRFHLYGDVHQPQATTWRVGGTRCINAGYFRATGRFLRFEGAVVVPARLG